MRYIYGWDEKEGKFYFALFSGKRAYVVFSSISILNERTYAIESWTLRLHVYRDTECRSIFLR